VLVGAEVGQFVVSTAVIEDDVVESVSGEQIKRLFDCGQRPVNSAARVGEQTR